MPFVFTRRAVAAMALLALAAGASAKDKFEPFVAGAQIVEALLPSSDPACQPSAAQPGAAATGHISGSGLATGIGAFTVTSTDCVRSANPYGLTPPFAFSSSNLTLTTANGDRIVASYSGTGSLNPLGLLVLSGNYTFTSGTGRFAAVQGSGTLTGVEDVSTFPARGFVTLTGTIAY